MPNPGGSATCYGVLFQILGTLHRAASVRLQSDPGHDELNDCLLLIEPEAGGGDLQIGTANQRTVEQWKARSDRGTWSLRELVEQVLPDLYRATDGSERDAGTVYRFVTEGGRGRWPEAERFFQSLRDLPVPAEPLAALSDDPAVHRLADETLSDRELFRRIAKRVSKGNPDADTYRRLWRLLGRFEMADRLPLAEIQQRVRDFLREVIDYDEDVEAKLLELCGIVLELAAQGDVRITAAELLVRAGLRAARPTWEGLRQQLQQRVLRKIELQWDAPAISDIAVACEWPKSKPILILSGPRATEQLVAWAKKSLAGDGLTTLAVARENAKDTLDEAAELIWQDALKHDRELSLPRLIERLPEPYPVGSKPWLTVLVYDAITLEGAQDLVSQDWERWGARLVLSTSPAIAVSLRQRWPQRVHLLPTTAVPRPPRRDPRAGVLQLLISHHQSRERIRKLTSRLDIGLALHDISLPAGEAVAALFEICELEGKLPRLLQNAFQTLPAAAADELFELAQHLPGLEAGGLRGVPRQIPPSEVQARLAELVPSEICWDDTAAAESAAAYAREPLGLWALSRVLVRQDAGLPLAGKWKTEFQRRHAECDHQIRQARSRGWLNADYQFTDAGLCLALAAWYLTRRFVEEPAEGVGLLEWLLDRSDTLPRHLEELLENLVRDWPQASETLLAWQDRVLLRADQPTPLSNVERLFLARRLLVSDRLLEQRRRDEGRGSAEPACVRWLYRVHMTQYLGQVLEVLGVTEPDVFLGHLGCADDEETQRGLAGALRRLLVRRGGAALPQWPTEWALLIAIYCDLPEPPEAVIQRLRRDNAVRRQWLALPVGTLGERQVEELRRLLLGGSPDDRQRACQKVSHVVDLWKVWQWLGAARESWILAMTPRHLGRPNVKRLLHQLERLGPSCHLDEAARTAAEHLQIRWRTVTGQFEA